MKDHRRTFDETFEILEKIVFSGSFLIKEKNFISGWLFELLKIEISFMGPA